MYIEKIFDISSKCYKEYSKFKQKHNLIDYSDMERYAHDMLTLDGYECIRKEISDSYKYIFVDEYQDCSPLQVKIFDILSELVDGGSFWVGDTKQIVYSWRGAHPLLIEALIEKIKTEDSCSIGEALNISRRSAPGIVKAVRDTFSSLYPETKGFTHWDKRADECKDIKDPIRLWPISDDTPLEYYVYSLIHKNGVKPGDIGILGRGNDNLKKIATALEHVGINVDCSSSETAVGVDNPVVALVMAVLKVIASKYDHQAKAEIAYLLSPGYGIGEIIDAKLSWENTEKDIRGEFLNEIGIIKKIIDNRVNWTRLSICDLIETVVVELNLHEFAATINGVSNVDVILQKIIETAYTYNDRCHKMHLAATIIGFVSYLSMMCLSKNGNEDCLHLCTYHKSKGREWKYVILTDLQNNVNRSNEWYVKNYSGVHVDHPTEPTPQNFYTETVIRLQPWLFGRKNSIPNELQTKVDIGHIESIKKANVNEAARLMYVGMTRARDVLIFATKVKSLEPLDGITKTWFDVIGAPFPKDSCKVCKCVVDDGMSKNSISTVQVPNICREKTDSIDVCRDINPSECKATGEIERGEYWNCRLPLKKADGQDISDAEIGDAIHEIYYGTERNSNKEHIKQILDAYGIDPVDDLVNKIIDNWNHLISYLTAIYGNGKTYHELPFKYKDDGQIYTGSIDFLWETMDGVVLVDYKSCQLGISHIENKDNPHYAGLYKGQLDCYTTALEKAGRKVIDRLIFYPSLGLVVKVI